MQLVLTVCTNTCSDYHVAVITLNKLSLFAYNFMFVLIKSLAFCPLEVLLQYKKVRSRQDAMLTSQSRSYVQRLRGDMQHR